MHERPHLPVFLLCRYPFCLGRGQVCPASASAETRDKLNTKKRNEPNNVEPATSQHSAFVALIIWYLLICGIELVALLRSIDVFRYRTRMEDSALVCSWFLAHSELPRHAKVFLAVSPSFCSRGAKLCRVTIGTREQQL